MSLSSFITTALLLGGLADAIGSDNGTWLQSYPIRSGLAKRLVERDLQGKFFNRLRIGILVWNYIDLFVTAKYRENRSLNPSLVL